MKIFIIHNESDNVRGANIKKQFASQTIKPEYEIVPAIMDYDAPRSGISKSHKECIRKAKEANAPWCMIIEDDIEFLNHSSLGIFMLQFYKFRSFMEYHNQEWDLFFGGLYEGEVHETFLNTVLSTNSNSDVKSQFSIVKVRGKVSGLHLYIISEKFYDKFLTANEQINLDHELSISLEAKMFAIYPFVAIQGIYPSASGNDMAEFNRNLGLKYKLLQKEPK